MSDIHITDVKFSILCQPVKPEPLIGNIALLEAQISEMLFVDVVAMVLMLLKYLGCVYA